MEKKRKLYGKDVDSAKVYTGKGKMDNKITNSARTPSCKCYHQEDRKSVHTTNKQKKSSPPSSSASTVKTTGNISIRRTRSLRSQSVTEDDALIALVAMKNSVKYKR